MPEEASAALNLSKKDTVEISWDENTIVIRKGQLLCKLCGSKENLNENLGLCKHCIDRIKAE